MGIYSNIFERLDILEAGESPALYLSNRVIYERIRVLSQPLRKIPGEGVQVGSQINLQQRLSRETCQPLYDYLLR